MSFLGPVVIQGLRPLRILVLIGVTADFGPLFGRGSSMVVFTANGGGGVVTRRGSGAGTVAFFASGSGVVRKFGSGSSIMAFTASGRGYRVATGSGSSVMTFTAIAAQISQPGGGSNNRADHTDPNNAYLAAMAA